MSKEKAIELVDKFYLFTASFDNDQAKECAILTCEEVMKATFEKDNIYYEYQQTIEEIKKL